MHLTLIAAFPGIITLTKIDLRSLQILCESVFLKVVSATFLLVCFLSLNENTCQTRKKNFLFHLKSLFRSQENQILEFYVLKFHDVIKCLSIKQEIHFTNNLGSKHSLLMKFGQFMSYEKRKNFIKKFYQNCGLKTSSRPFLCLQRIKHNF